MVGAPDTIRFYETVKERGSAVGAMLTNTSVLAPLIALCAWETKHHKLFVHNFNTLFGTLFRKLTGQTDRLPIAPQERTRWCFWTHSG